MPPLFRWSPLGGLGEVGMNTMVFRFGALSVPVDAGIAFADPNDFGIEAVHVDYREVLREERPPCWIITHAHEDHIGAVAGVLQAAVDEGIDPPEVLAPPLAAALILEKMGDDPRYPDAKRHRGKVRAVKPGTSVELSDEVIVHFLEARHSTLDTCSLAFEWHTLGMSRPLRIVHTADFKLDDHAYVDGAKTVAGTYGIFGVERPDFLFVDSTNAERPGHSVGEAEVLPGLEKLIAAAQGRVFLTLFSSNVQRIAAIVKLAARLGRRSCLAGRSMQTAHRLSMELGLYGRACDEIQFAHLVDASELSRQPPSRQLVLCSGSQGENRSVLMRMAQGTHPELHLGPGDRVIFSSKLIPGNERSVGRLINGLLRQGADILMGENAREQAGGPIHASGHARAGEIEAVMRYLRPKHVVPVHGELRHLMSCAAIAHRAGPEWKLSPKQVYVTENGAELSFALESDEWKLVERRRPADIPERMLRYEHFTALSRDPFLRVRKRAASQGVLSVSLDSLGRARLSMDGVFPAEIFEGDFREGIENEVREWVHQRFRQLNGAAFRREDPGLENEIAEDLARQFRRLTGIRPHVVVHLVGG